MGHVKTPHVSARVQTAIELFISQLRRRQIQGSHAVSEKMLDILRMVVSSGKWGTVNVLIDLIKLVGKRCQDAQPMELCTGNTVRRLLNVIREECHQLQADARAAATTGSASATSAPIAIAPSAATPAAAAGDDAALSPTHASHLHHHHHKPSVFSLFPDADTDAIDFAAIKSTTTKSLFVEAVNEMIDELRGLHESIAAQSVAHIHSNEVILTCGDSMTSETFFKYAAKKRQFHVIVVESAPAFSGQRLAAKLAAAGIETTVIPDAAVFAVMSRVNKVVLGTHAVLANGGLVAVAGASTLAAAAKHYGVPVVVVAGLYKLTPQHPFDLDVFNLMTAPAAVAPYADPDLSARAEVLAPQCDYVAPELVSLFITNEGAFAPSYMYRLLTESYHMDDVDLEPSPGAFDRFFAQSEKKAATAAAAARKSAESPSSGGSSAPAVAAAVADDEDDE
ncbi:GCD complex subunit gcd7 [Blastocladiella emersonii ATCC 22665]|nr:GCD complex subunit gcd7 [Blastocladiella emersonii ATCC 22665]